MSTHSKVIEMPLLKLKFYLLTIKILYKFAKENEKKEALKLFADNLQFAIAKKKR